MHKLNTINHIFTLIISLTLTTFGFGQLSLLKNIGTSTFASGSGPGFQSGMVVHNNRAYFGALDKTHYAGIWSTDGTPAGTSLIKELGIFECEYIEDLTLVGSDLFFTAEYFSAVKVIWKSDKTEAGTNPLRAATTNQIIPYTDNLTNINGTLYFSTYTSPHRRTTIWKSDGTDAGTVPIHVIDSTASDMYTGNFTAFNNELYFTVSTQNEGIELWKCDGTAAGTYRIKDINPGKNSSEPEDLIVYNGYLYFSATNGTLGRELWRTDGTEAGTTLVMDLFPGASSSNPQNMTLYQSKLFFSGNEGVNGAELWKTDGTQAGTSLVKDISNSSGGSFPRSLTVNNGSLYFGVFDASGNPELWKSTGTSFGTTAVKSFAGQILGTNFISCNNKLFFDASESLSGVELWVSDGTFAGTKEIEEIHPGLFGGNPSSLTNLNGTLLFSASNGTQDSELWKSDGTAAGTEMVKNINTELDELAIYSSTRMNKKLFFSVGGITPQYKKIWQSDGTAAGTFGFGPDFKYPVQDMIAYKNQVFFNATTDADGEELWKTDGTDAGTTIVKNLAALSADSDPKEFIVLNDSLYFTAEIHTSYKRYLWKSDGTAAGTIPLSGINYPNIDYPEDLTVANGKLYFTALKGSGDRGQLWEFNGTAYRLVKSFTQIKYIGESNGSLIIFDSPGYNGNVEIWKLDPGTTSPQFIKAVSGVASYSNTLPETFSTLNNNFYFFGVNNLNELELWSSDGTTSGTVVFKNFGPQDRGLPRELVSINGSLFFPVDDHVNGIELWKSDGTTAGTSLFKDINPGTSSGYPYDLKNVNGTLYFQANDGSNGFELWSLLGNSCSVVAYNDINPGNLSSHPKYVGKAFDKDLFLASNDQYGREIYTVDAIPATDVAACTSYTWSSNGKSYTESGIYHNLIPSVSGCDSLAIIDLTIFKQTLKDTIRVASCENSYLWSRTGVTYTAEGNYDLTVNNSNSCDSIITLVLTLNQLPTVQHVETVNCSTSFYWDKTGINYTADGIYTDTISYASGCDSVFTLHLTFNGPSSATIDLMNCISYFWPIDGNTYTVSGTYTATIPNVHGCDSVITLNLLIQSDSISIINTPFCGYYYWDVTGQEYFQIGVYIDTTITMDGCTVISTLNLHGDLDTTIIQVQECFGGGYFWDYSGQYYTESGNYTHTGYSNLSCDSIVTLELTLGQSYYSGGTNIETCASTYTYPSTGEVFTSSGSYQIPFTTITGCDSIIFLNLSLNTSPTRYFQKYICNSMDSFYWDLTGETYVGEGAHTAQVSDGNGCDSTIVLILSINTGTIINYIYDTLCSPTDVYISPLNGESYTTPGTYFLNTESDYCDTSNYLVLALSQPKERTIEINLCDHNGAYTWDLANNTVITIPGNYFVTIPNATGCDSIIRLILDKPDLETTKSLNFCNSVTQYTWEPTGQVYSVPGDYTITKTNGSGCDSIIHLSLNSLDSIITHVPVILCDSNGSYTWPSTGQTFTSAGDFTITQPNNTGCDSIFILHITVEVPERSLTLNFCKEVTQYTWQPTGQVYAVPGDYTITQSNGTSCDSTIYLSLKSKDSIVSNTSVSICEVNGSYTWQLTGQTYTVSGSYTHIKPNGTGCDSIFRLNLTIGEPLVRNIHAKLCGISDVFTWTPTGQTFNIAGDYTITKTNPTGCDSIIQLHLSVLTIDKTLSYQNDSTLRTNVTGIGVQYNWLNCDNDFSTVGVTTASFTTSETGHYAVQITKETCIDTSDCYKIELLDLNEEIISSDWHIFPNPTSNLITLKTNILKDNSYYTVYDINGRLILEGTVNSTVTTIDFSNLAVGAYQLKLRNVDAESVFKVLKE